MLRFALVLALVSMAIPWRVVETCDFLPRGAASAACRGG